MAETEFFPVEMHLIPPVTFKLLLPFACKWAEEQESIILRDGVVLTAARSRDAERIGIKAPERIRLRVVKEIPMPTNPLLRAAAERTGLILPFTIGLTLRYGIFIRADHWGERRLVIHEPAHSSIRTAGRLQWIPQRVSR